MYEFRHRRSIRCVTMSIVSAATEAFERMVERRTYWREKRKRPNVSAIQPVEVERDEVGTGAREVFEDRCRDVMERFRCSFERNPEAESEVPEGCWELSDIWLQSLVVPWVLVQLVPTSIAVAEVNSPSF